MADSKSFVREFLCESTDFRLIIEDDGRVCYAYVVSSNGIEGDVWLYNRGPAPSEPEWGDADRAPFANPKHLTKKDLPFFIPNSPDAFSVTWWVGGGGPEAKIYIDGVLAGILGTGDKPGQSIAAAVDGPLAKAIGE